MPLPSGTLAPDFILPDENGVPRRLSEFRGQPLVLYFYPKDDTPGCTVEACGFRDDYTEYLRAGILVIGISPDSPASHARFKQKHRLPFSLLADEDHKVCEQYGVWGKKRFMGRNYEGVLRTTFVIDRQGQIVKVFEDVRPAEHSAEVLAAIRELS